MKTDGFTAFDDTEQKKLQEAYQKEAKERWGETQSYHAYEKKTASYQQQDWDDAKQEMDTIFKNLSDCMPLGIEDEKVHHLVKQLREHITSRYYPCTNEQLCMLGQMYVQDERFTKNLEQYAQGFAQFTCDAIQYHCKQNA